MPIVSQSTEKIQSLGKKGRKAEGGGRNGAGGIRPDGLRLSGTKRFWEAIRERTGIRPLSLWERVGVRAPSLCNAFPTSGDHPGPHPSDHSPSVERGIFLDGLSVQVGSHRRLRRLPPHWTGWRFCLRLRHNLVILTKCLFTIWPKEDFLPLVVNAPGFAGLPVPGLCRTSHILRNCEF